jgi:hypothetical protein
VVVVGATVVVVSTEVVVGAAVGRGEAVVEAVTSAASTTADVGGLCRLLLKAATETTTVTRAMEKPPQKARGPFLRVRQVRIEAATYRFPDGARVGTR